MEINFERWGDFVMYLIMHGSDRAISRVCNESDLSLSSPTLFSL